MAAEGGEERGGGLEAAVRGGLRVLRERWMRGSRERGGTAAFAAPPHPALPGDAEEASALQRLPIDVQLNIMSFLSPQDLCRLGSTSSYWRAVVRDPLLWRYFLLRDLPLWTWVDWKSLPEVEVFDKAFSDASDKALYDYMAVYKKSCPQSRRSLRSSRPRYGAVTSFLQSLVTQVEPRFAMFGPGLEELDNSLVQKMMTCPEILLVAGLPHRQIHGIGSGVSFQFNNSQKFNILTLYSTTSVERRRARTEQAVAVNKMFYQDNSTEGNQQAVHYSVIDQVKKVCEVVDGFIYVANAEAHKKHDRQEERARILAMIDPALGPPTRPLLVLSCVSHTGVERTPCVYIAHQLQLNLLHQPWMVQDTVAATLDGLLNGIEWLLEEANCKNAQ
ncbi:F-box only protein 4 [Myiozetetes cayanensis]|uniref:F-box only protein 4 n=1 Tax=Myiozetetes cayanensis TaxID=478635 RepID=UPI00215E5D09|nr:F-box only protein 4 [Myiozetetes cayanensis]